MAENETNGAVQVKRGHPGDELFPTAEEAIKVANGRTKGPRQAFKQTMPNGEVRYNVSHHLHSSGCVGFLALGGKVERIGVVHKPGGGGRAPATADAALAFINSLPEAERAKLLAAWEGMKAGKAPAAPTPAAKPAHSGKK